MSFNILKSQIKYCFLNKEDQELQSLKSKRSPKDTTNIKKLNSIEEDNKNYFNQIKLSKQKISQKQFNKIDTLFNVNGNK